MLYLTKPFDVREFISLLSDFCCLMSMSKHVEALTGSGEFCVNYRLFSDNTDSDTVNTFYVSVI